MTTVDPPVGGLTAPASVLIALIQPAYVPSNVALIGATLFHLF